MDGRWDAWAPNAFLEQSGPADQPTYPDGLLLPNSSHAGAGEAVEDLLHPGLPVGGHRLQQGDALRERPGPLQGLAELVSRTRPPESPSRWVYTPEPGKWACPYRAMRRWGHILQMRRSQVEQLHQGLACKPASAARARDLLQHLPTPLTPRRLGDVALVLSELLTNALRHGCGDPADEIDFPHPADRRRGAHRDGAALCDLRARRGPPPRARRRAG